MNLKNYFLLFLLFVFAINSNAQESTPNVAMQANISVEVTPEYIPSIASRLADLPPYVDVVKEAADKRSLGNTVIIGKCNPGIICCVTPSHTTYHKRSVKSSPISCPKLLHPEN